MESVPTRVKEQIRSILLFINYLLWLILSPSKFKKIRKKEIKKVVIISYGAIGELLILSSLLPVLKKSLNCEINFMLASENRNVFKNNPYVSEVIISKNNFKENIQNLKKRKFDLAIITKPISFGCSFMCLLAKIKYQIGSGGRGTNVGKGPPMFFNKNFFTRKKQHVIEDNLDIIRQIGIDNKNPKIEFYLSEKEKRRAQKKLNKLKIKDYVIIHPGFRGAGKLKYPAKLWPLEKYVKIINFISENYKVKILLTGSEEQREFINKITKKVKNGKTVLNAAGIFDIEELAYVISKSRLIIAPNTGAVHFASLSNTPLIELEGVGRPWQWYPLRQDKNYKILYHPEVCTGCNGVECRKKTIECMEAISVGEVENTIRELL